MKSADKKEQFILLRAEGHSYTEIAHQLSISKSTCSKWERDFSEEIRRAKADRLSDLYTLYRIGKAQHIEKLGETLRRIDEALADMDLSEIPPEKLLKLKLEYEERLQAQYAEPTPGGESFKDFTQEELLQAVASLYERVKAGGVSHQQAKAELATLEGVQRAISEANSIW